MHANLNFPALGLESEQHSKHGDVAIQLATYGGSDHEYHFD